MTDRGQIKRTVLDSKSAPHFFQLPHVKAPNLHNWRHERDAEDIYVALEVSGLIHEWYWQPTSETLEVNLMADRSSVLWIDDEVMIIFWEVDEGTMIHAKLSEKLDKYIELSNKAPYPFHVIFTAPTIGRVNNILTDLLAPRKRGNQFLAVEHSRLVNEPLTNVLLSPKQPNNPFSFSSLMSNDLAEFGKIV